MTSDKSILGHYETLKRGVNGFSPFMVGERFYNWENFREYASKTATLFKSLAKAKKQETREAKDIEEMIEVLEALPSEERWFMDFDDMSLSPKVVRNWFQFYS